MRLTIISDTHGEQEKLGVLSGEVLIHCGDMFNMFSGDHDEFERIDDWFGRQEFDLILCVGGNHDFELQKRALYTDRPFRNAGHNYPPEWMCSSRTRLPPENWMFPAGENRWVVSI